MAGQMGNKQVTTQNLEVAAIDLEDNLILVKGSVPGPKSGWVYVSDAVKRKAPDEAPKPLGVKEGTAKASDSPKEETPAAEAPAEAPAEEAKADNNEKSGE